MRSAASLDIILQCHGCRGMPCCRLPLLDVPGLIVNICQYRRPEADRRDLVLEADLFPDPITHPTNLGVAERLSVTKRIQRDLGQP